jgi:hypothetical protein
MSADILSDKELSSLLKLAAAAIDNDDLSVEEGADLVESLDFAAKALDARRGMTDEPHRPALLDEKPARVIVATYSYKHGDDVRVFVSDDGAEAWRQEIAATWWGNEMGREKIPADPAEAADVYFDTMMDSGAETFRTESVEVEADPAPEESTCAEVEAAMQADEARAAAAKQSATHDA